MYWLQILQLHIHLQLHIQTGESEDESVIEVRPHRRNLRQSTKTDTTNSGDTTTPRANPITQDMIRECLQTFTQGLGYGVNEEDVAHIEQDLLPQYGGDVGRAVQDFINYSILSDDEDEEEVESQPPLPPLLPEVIDLTDDPDELDAQIVMKVSSNGHNISFNRQLRN